MKKAMIKNVKKHIQGGWPEDNLGYRVRVGKYTYYIRISPEKNRDGIVREYVMDLGGRKRGCVSLRIPTLASAVPDCDDGKRALLKYLKYDPMCSANSDRDLVSGFGTKHMLKTALYFAKELCPNTDIQTFRFMDTSRKLCDDGIYIDLPYFMVAMYGKTYYEKYFFARLEEDYDNQQYMAAISKLKKVPRDVMSFDIFANSFNINDEQANKIKALYESANSFTEFFQSIRKKYAKTVCQLLQGWVNIFVTTWVFSTKDFFSRFWTIPANKIPEIDIADWEIISVDSVEMRILNQEQEGGDRESHFLGRWDPEDD